MDKQLPLTKDQLLAAKTIAEGKELYCPNCKQYYIPILPNKAAAAFSNDVTEKQQWTSGLCSDRCWSQFIQNGDEEIILF